MRRRLVHLEGDLQDLELARKALQTANTRIVDVNGETYLEAPAITEAADASAARELADELLPRLSGLLRVEAGVRSPLKVGSIVEFDDDGTKHAFVVVHAQAALAVAVAGQASIDGAPLAPTRRPLDAGLQQLGNPQVALVLDLLAEPPGWVSFYKVLDVVEESLGGERALDAKGWVSATSLKRLTMTANAIETARDGGRHASSKSSISKSKLAPMQLDEAWEVVRKLVRSWLLTRT